jgi:capsular exopolysaccharide synthesis family protein
LRTALTFLAIDRPFQTLQVTSAKMSEGKSTTAANLAVAMCRAEGKRVLLVDADLRRPKMHSLFSLANKVGLCDVLLRDLPMADAVVPIEGFNGLLSVLPVGPRPSGLNAELLSSSLFAALLRESLASYDLVILDTPPVLSVADPLTVSSQADAVLFVVHAGESTTAQVRSSLDALVGVGASVVGAILNSFDARAAGYHGYYGNYGYFGYYGYYGAGEYAETSEAGPMASSSKRGRRGS